MGGGGNTGSQKASSGGWWKEVASSRCQAVGSGGRREVALANWRAMEVCWRRWKVVVAKQSVAEERKGLANLLAERPVGSVFG